MEVSSKFIDKIGSCAVTAIGSLPYATAGEALDVILERFRQIPLWPQLPMRSPLEGMYLQYGEGMPCLRDEGGHVFFDTSSALEEELERFYEHLLAEDVEYFAVSEERAQGLYELLARRDAVRAIDPAAVKGHVTGPISYGFTLCDEARKPIFYHQALMEAVTQTLRMKARWQIARLQIVFPRVVIFVDEPYLGATGSAMVRISNEEILEHLGVLFDEIRSHGAVSGLHCCANTDWGLLLGSGVDMMSFDAYGYGDNFLLFHEQIRRFLDRGGLICWGIAPTTPEATGVTAQELTAKMEGYLARLEAKGLPRERVLRSSLFSPSCGMGTLPESTALHIMKLTEETARALRERP